MENKTFPISLPPSGDDRALVVILYYHSSSPVEQKQSETLSD